METAHTYERVCVKDKDEERAYTENGGLGIGRRRSHQSLGFLAEGGGATIQSWLTGRVMEMIV